MVFDPQKHHRRSIRLKGYDYSQPGGYYVTIVTQNRGCLFGEVVEGKMVLNDAGKMIQRIWNELPKRFANIELDESIVMPNHFHGILIIIEKTNKTLGDIVGAFESITTHEYILGVKNNGWPRFNKKLWQRNYWEHIIRGDNDLNRIREYIINNPMQWKTDNENPNIPLGQPLWLPQLTVSRWTGAQIDVLRLAVAQIDVLRLAVAQIDVLRLAVVRYFKKDRHKACPYGDYDNNLWF